jgi:hypothetical protein
MVRLSHFATEHTARTTGPKTALPGRTEAGGQMFVVEIPLPTLSLNKLQRMHWAQRKRLRDQYERIIRLVRRPCDRVKRYEFRCVKIERHGVRQLDHDNFVGGCKPLIDALKNVGLIWDDSPSYCRVKYTQHQIGTKRARTVVSIT